MKKNLNRALKAELRRESGLQAAWIRGLPGETKPEGTPIEVVNFKTPQLEMGKISIVLKTTPDLTLKLQNLSSTKLTLPKLSLVVRMDAKTESDNAYNMAGAQIVSVSSLEGEGLLAVNVGFNKIEVKAGINLNPGPPAEALKVQDTGLNSGWIYGLSKDSTDGMQVEIVDFNSPSSNGQLKVTFGKSTLDVARLLTRMPLHDLTLVLPDRASQSYVEFKLWDVRATAVAGSNGRQVLFESNRIEHFTG
jgi:hypothetical protein